MLSDKLGDRLQDQMGALHVWHHGAHDQSCRGGYIGYIRMTTSSETQQNKHAPWQAWQARAAEKMDTKYSTAPMREHIKITLLSQWLPNQGSHGGEVELSTLDLHMNTRIHIQSAGGVELGFPEWSLVGLRPMGFYCP